MLSTFETGGPTFLTAQAPTRYAVRQVLDQELYKTITLRVNAARQARFSAGSKPGTSNEYDFDDKENKSQKQDDGKHKLLSHKVKRDFFGRIIEIPLQDLDANAGEGAKRRPGSGHGKKVWVTYHEGLNNAVRRPIALEDFLRVF